ncbi:class I fructose-bisphosphate aldolase [Sphingobium sp. D43FB]|uniref:class I fructose-bisphosphate aldolase n=1 Tax=Sphingobium sp. D43FB TaxID=2017595 RepID=UPI000BB558BD|nr:class I fructose-bisphosphate aldolase [Sphingobium sp. D43FB]PBN43576.1 fructose-bisphosphate aldolase class I [Sphingobium sp. D43FB]
MNSGTLAGIAAQLMANDKGLLAIDESVGTCNQRFAALGIAQSAESRRRWRELIIATPDLSQSISGVILYDETIHQATADGRAFVDVLASAGILVGIKVDTGAKALAGFPGETITEGLDGLRDRLQAYATLGARFAKWRAVFSAEDGTPSPACIKANAHALGRYAALCQEAGLVPIVEPELLMAGDHDIEYCGKLSQTILETVFSQLSAQRVLLEGMILKPNMVLAGSECVDQATLDRIVDETVTCLLRSVPAAVPGIAFLSGGQSPELASARLNALNAPSATKLPWPLGFSYGRAIQQPALALWGGQDANSGLAQASLAERARCNRAARSGAYVASTDVTP